MRELPLVFACEQDYLLGILHPASRANDIGVLLVVGGPQYRVGSHRQFVLLARHVSAAGFPVLRFDYRGLGDSQGAARDFEQIDDDIRAAVDEFFRQQPELKRVVIWGLCDAASAALFYAHRDSRIAGLILANPWVRTQSGQARSYLRHYYWQHVLDKNFWRRVWRGEFKFFTAAKNFVRHVLSAYGGNRAQADVAESTLPLPQRMCRGLQQFTGPALFIISGDDLTAAEFVDVAQADPQWLAVMQQARIQQQPFAEANHTFSQQAWRDQVAAWTVTWLQSLSARTAE